MKFSIITIFPDMLRPYINESILGRAQEDELVEVELVDPRNFTTDKHRSIDAEPYGGGPGMVMQAEPIMAAIESISYERKTVGVVFFAATGEQFTNEAARDLSDRYDHVIMICGRYEGVDERLKQMICDTIGCHRLHTVSVGPYVLTGGELPALVVLDATARQLPGVLGNENSREEERVLGAPAFTRPQEIIHGEKTYKVPDVLLSGHHAKIDQWRADHAQKS